jgi:ring-1,2-phenylacetyl-CoA epoxidase subunit PaaB
MTATSGARPPTGLPDATTDITADNPVRSDAASELEPYEVFRQAKEGGPMRHGGNVMAPDAELAMHYARELFGRRGESTRLWIVRRGDVQVLEDPDLLQPPLDRSFKKPGGYVMRDKLATARDRAGTAKPGARAGSHDTTGRRRPGPADSPRGKA